MQLGKVTTGKTKTKQVVCTCKLNDVTRVRLSSPHIDTKSLLLIKKNKTETIYI